MFIFFIKSVKQSAFYAMFSPQSCSDKNSYHRVALACLVVTNLDQVAFEMDMNKQKIKLQVVLKMKKKTMKNWKTKMKHHVVQTFYK